MKKYFILVFSLLSVLLLVSCGSNPTHQAVGSDPVLRENATREPENTATLVDNVLPSATSTATQIPPTQTPTLEPSPTQIPLITMPLIGSEPHHPESESTLTLLTEVGAQIIRFNGVVWYNVEPQEGQYDWGSLQKLDIAMRELAARDIEVILIVRGTPDWAQKVPGSACGPIAQEKFGSFAIFMSELVRRYSQPPYNVKYWELGNEPDVAPELVPSNYPFGCWGDSADENYGGGYYAEMLKVVYPAVKSVDQEAQILIGGLLLDCDPYYPPEGKDCLPSRFLNGILANGGANYFDIVSFHGYPPYQNQSMSQEWESPGWAARGGVVVGKIDYLRSVMQQYGANKPLFLTESSLLCPDGNKNECMPPDEHFYETQADYLVRLFVRNWALDVAGTIWYDFEGKGWRNGGLVGEDANNPKPAFQAFKYLNEKLVGMSYIGESPLPNGLQGYIFVDDDRETWVIWSQDESPQAMELPSNVIVVYDKYGQAVALQDQLEVSSPVYLDMVPNE